MERMARLNYINTVYHKVQSEVKWALGSITTNKASEVIKYQLSYFKS